MKPLPTTWGHPGPLRDPQELANAYLRLAELAHAKGDLALFGQKTVP